MKERAAERRRKFLGIDEMARVGNFDAAGDRFEVWIYHEPLANPSFHLVNKTAGYEVVLQIKDLKAIEWKKRGRYKELPVSHLRAIVVFLKQGTDKNPTITNWTALHTAWVQNNPSSKLDYVMPNYRV